MRSGLGVYGAPSSSLSPSAAAAVPSLTVQQAGTSAGYHSGSASPSTLSAAHSSQHSHLNNHTGSGPVLETTIVSGGPKEALKTQFVTREGVYRQMTVSEQLCKSRVNLAQTVQGMNTTTSNAPVRVSFVRIPQSTSTTDSEQGEVNGLQPVEEACVQERICFNIGRDLYVYDFENITGSLDWSKPLDKRVYKGTYPTCHDFNQHSVSAASCALIVGFSAGQIQLIDPFQKDYPTSKLYNEERLVEKSPVTCLRWVPGQARQFVAAHQSGFMYVYSEELACVAVSPSYTNVKQADHFCVSAMKSRPNKNPVRRIQVGRGAINQFEFAPNSSDLMAVVGQDGFLRVFRFTPMELLCQMRSYFGGLLCLAWSPDQRFIATGGEDDLLTVFAVAENRVVCRGHGHKSWVSQVAFDPFVDLNRRRSSCAELKLNGNAARHSPTNEPAPTSSKEPARPACDNHVPTTVEERRSRLTHLAVNKNKAPEGASGESAARPTANWSDASFDLPFSDSSSEPVFYRIGTVSHDTQLCLWDVGTDVLAALKDPAHQPSTSANMSASVTTTHSTAMVNNLTGAESADRRSTSPICSDATDSTTGAKEAKESKSKPKRFLHKRVLSFGNRHGNNGDRSARSARVSTASAPNGAAHPLDAAPDPAAQLYGTAQCPRIDSVPLIEPLVCKKIAHERLTVLCFRPDCLVTACQEGFVCTWARPGRVVTRI